MDRKEIEEILTKIENGEEAKLDNVDKVSGETQSKETKDTNPVEEKTTSSKKEKSSQEEKVVDLEKEGREENQTDDKFANLSETVIKTNGKPLEECTAPLLPCANDLRLSVKKYTGEYVIDEDCCTALTLILKNDGNIATSFMGAHNVLVVKTLEKSLKQYFKAIKKTLKAEQKKKSTEDEIKIVKSDEENAEIPSQENNEKKSQEVVDK